MGRLLLVAALVVALAPAATAQTPRWALGGTLVGITYFSESGLLDVGIPGGGPLAIANTPRAAPEVYFGFFPHPEVAVLPGIAFTVLDPDASDTGYSLGLDLAVEWHVSTVTESSTYAAANVAFLVLDSGTGDSDSELVAGVAIGYRWLLTEFFALRTEAVFRRYLDFEQNQLSAVLKAEVVFN